MVQSRSAPAMSQMKNIKRGFFISCRDIIIERARRKAGLLRGWRFGFFIALKVCCALTFSSAVHARDFTGKVVGVQDGDTLTIRQDNGIATRIRLWWIDAPEKRQAYSNVSKRYLSSLTFGKRVRALVRDTDRYGRTVAEIILPNGRNANREMLKAGYAWWYRRYAPNDWVLESLEIQARKAKRGLWADPHAVPPWEYRKVRRGR